MLSLKAKGVQRQIRTTCPRLLVRVGQLILLNLFLKVSFKAFFQGFITFLKIHISADEQLKGLPLRAQLNAHSCRLYISAVSSVLSRFSTRSALTLHTAHAILPVFSCFSPSQSTVKDTEH